MMADLGKWDVNLLSSLLAPKLNCVLFYVIKVNTGYDSYWTKSFLLYCRLRVNEKRVLVHWTAPMVVFKAIE